MNEMPEASLPERPTVLVLASTYPRWLNDTEPGFVHELCKRLVDRFRVIVLCPHAPQALTREFMDRVEIIRYRYAPEKFEVLVNGGGIVTNLRVRKWTLLLLPGFIAAQSWMLLRLVLKEKPRIVHAHWLIPQGFLAALLRLIGRRAPPFIVTSHGADLFALRGIFFNAIKRFVLKRAALVTVVSAGMCAEIERLGMGSSRMRVEPMGVDLERRFFPESSIRRASNEILFVGRLVEKKGLRHLLDAMPLVLAVHPEAILRVVGFGPEEVERRLQAETLGVAKSVVFSGALTQEELPMMYRRASLFVAPFVQASSGDQEGLGLVLVEALGCGCPVVVSDLPGTREVDAKGLFRVLPGDSVVLAKAICEVLEKRHVVDVSAVKKFDWKSRAGAYAECIDFVIRGGAG